MSRIAQPSSGKTDQRKVYTDWANNRLKKAGLSNVHVTDIQKDIPDGYILPKIIQAVVHEEVPGILSSPDNQEEKRQNVEASVMFLQRIGVNCNGFSAKDVSEGSMRAILQLFFSLSQFKPKDESSSSTAAPPPSRLKRPVSPSIRMTHSVQPRTTTEGSSLNKLKSPNGPVSHLLSTSLSSTPSGSQSSSANTSPVTTPVTNPLISPFAPPSTTTTTSTSAGTQGTKVPQGPRRHAGSSIPTGLDPLGQVRRVPYRSLSINNTTGATIDNKDEQKQKNDVNSPPGFSPNESSAVVMEMGPPMSTSVPRSLGLPVPKTSIGGSLKSPGSISLKSSHSIGSDNVLSSSTESFRSDDESLTSSVFSSSGGGGTSKLSRSSSSVTESTSPGLRTRFAMPSGRSTPTGERSGLARPSRLQKESSSSSELIKKRSNTLDSSSLSKLEPSPSPNDEGSSKLSGLSKPSQITRPSEGSNNNKSKEESKLQRLTKLKSPNPTGTTGISTGITDTTTSHEPSPPPNKEDNTGKGSTTSRLAEMTRKSPSLLHKTQIKKGHTPSLLSTLTSKDTPTSVNEQESSSTEQAPPTSKLQAPLTSKLQAPPTSKLQTPLSKLQAPPTSKLQAPPSKLQGPTTSKIQAPPTSKLQAPTSSSSSSSSKLQAPPTSSSSSSSKLQAPPTSNENKDETKPNFDETSNNNVQETTPTTKDVIKTHTLPPLKIGSETTPPKPTQSGSSADPRSSTSSLASYNSSASSNGSVSNSNTDLQTPSPFGERKYAQRTSPEGMSVDETASPRDHRLSDSSETEKNNKEEDFIVLEKENIANSPVVIKRAQSLSPKFSRRIFPIPSHLSDSIQQQPGSTSGSGILSPGSDDSLSSTDKQPKRSSLRITNKKPGDARSDKHVKISPHSSVESFSSSDVSLGQSGGVPSQVSNETPIRVPAVEQKRRTSQNERPKSMEDLEKHKFAVTGFPGDLQTNLVRRGSTRSERLDYSSVETFLETGLQERNGSSTPELLETYENQLSHLKKDLENKAKMLSMYESSMVDLSSKVTSLKRTLEEKDAAIKHLTEERHKWHEPSLYDTHSLAPSRLGGVIDPGALSDGGFSDGGGIGSGFGGGGGDIEKEISPNKKKDKKWKRFSMRHKKNRSKKEQSEINQMEVASLAGSVAGSVAPGGSRSIKRSGTIGGSSNRKPSDLISISEYETRTIRDFDAKSLDAHSECYMTLPLMEDLLSIYEDSGEGIRVTVELLMDDERAAHEDSVETMVLGDIVVSEDCSWIMMDTKICDIFHHHINAIDPEQSLHLTDDSILHYMMDDVRRSIGNALLPFTTPYQAANNDSRITLALKGVAQESCDALAYKYLVSVDVLQSYVSLLLETQWIVVMGTKGTCKTSIAEGLVSYLNLYVEGEEIEDELTIDDTDKKTIKQFSISSAPGTVGGGLESALKYMKGELTSRIDRSTTPILLFDNIYDCHSLEQVLSVAGTLPKRPYIVATLCSGSTRGIPLHQLMFRHNIRVVTCSPQAEPILGILSRTLRKRVYQMKSDPDIEVEAVVDQLIIWLPYLLDHLNYFINKFHSNNVALGPRVFLNCPLDTPTANMEVWFINLWNHFIIPYLMGTIMAGIETYSADPHLDWIDVREWVIETYPWPSMNVSKLKTLNPDDVGWSHAVRPQNQNRFMPYMRDDDAQSVLRMQS